MSISGSFAPPSVVVEIPNPQVHVDFGAPTVREYVDYPTYDGDYTVTPSGEEQVIPTKNKRMTDDFVVAPIPENYGLITWDGSVITVS